MIPWQSVLFNALWIVGLAVLLADLSYHYWLAHEEGRGMREQLGRPAFLRFAWLGVALVAAGLAGTSNRVWELVVWALFTLFCIVQMVRSR
jgi:hypothetical protein